MSRSKNTAGYSVIEILVAVVVFAIGVMGLAGLIPLATRNLSRSAGTSSANSLAQGKLEELENANGTSDLDSGAGADTLEGRFVRRWTVTEDSPLPGMTSIRVEVRWDDNGPQRIELSTSVLNNG